MDFLPSLQAIFSSPVLQIILASSVVSAIISAFISYWTARFQTKSSYINDYYKKLLDRRLNAYEQVEAIVSDLCAITQLDDGRPVQLIFFSGYDDYIKFLVALNIASKNSFWLSDDL